MQDKDHTPLDPSLVDLGWEQMHKQLDKVMPVDNTGRRKAWFFWFLGLLVLCMTIAGANFYLTKTNKEETRPKTENVLAEGNKESTINESTAITEKTTPTNLNTNSIISDQENKNAVVPKSTINQSASKLTPKTSINVASTETVIAQTIDKEKTENNLTGEQAIETIQWEKPLDEMEVISSSLPKEESPLNNAITPFIATKEFAIDQNELDDIMTEVVPKGRKNNKTSLFVAGNLGLGLDDKGQTASLGLGLERRINKNWSLDASLAYQIHQIGKTGLIDNDNNAVVGGTLEDIETAGPSYFVRLDTLNIFTPLNKVKSERLVMNFQAAYRLNNSRWRFNAGLSVAYRRTAKIPIKYFDELDTYSINRVDELFDIYDKETISVGALSALNNTLINSPVDPNRWELATTAGLAYQITPKAALTSNYRLLLNDWPQKGNHFGTKSWFNVGLRYYIR